MLDYKFYEKLLEANNTNSKKVCDDLKGEISQQTLSQWKLGETTPKIDKIVKLSKYFNVPIEYFIDGKMTSSKEVEDSDMMLAKAISKSKIKSLIEKLLKLDEKDSKIGVIKGILEI